MYSDTFPLISIPWTDRYLIDSVYNETCKDSVKAVSNKRCVGQMSVGRIVFDENRRNPRLMLLLIDVSGFITIELDGFQSD